VPNCVLLPNLSASKEMPLSDLDLTFTKPNLVSLADGEIKKNPQQDDFIIASYSFHPSC
jgi:hypothetical protein